MKIALDDNVAEPGATLTSVAYQFGALGADTKLVTLSIGGNDVDWASIVVLCALNPEQDCAEAAAVTGQAISQAQGALPPVYQAVRRAAPNAHVVVTGYPRLFSPEFGDFTGVVYFTGQPVPFELTVAEQTMLNDLADQLNAVITDKATKARFQFVDVTKRFDGHGVNSDDPWITGVQSPVPLHPNASGQKAYAAAVTSSVNPGSLR